MSELSLSLPDSAMPEGFSYRGEVLSQAEGEALVSQIAALELLPFEFHGYRAHRRVHSYGWRYDYAAQVLRPAEPLPGFLLPVRERAAAAAGLAADRLQQALVTEYAPGAGIGWHRDKPMFGELVAVSLSAACRLRFRRRQGRGWLRASVLLEPRSVYHLTGPARLDWEHGIAPLDRLRYSVTFRTLVRSEARPLPAR